MSYDLSAPLLSEEIQATVLTFFSRHFRPWYELRQGPDPLFPEEPPNFTAASAPTSVLPSDPQPYKVGIHYGAIVGGERRYVWSIVAFIALRWGAKKLFGSHPRPYLRYEGDLGEDLPLFLDFEPTSLPEDQRWQAVDHLGIQTMYRQHYDSMPLTDPGDLGRIEAELLRLQALL